jgi:hypothetical protein
MYYRVLVYSLVEKEMKLKSESYPDHIRRIAHDLGKLRGQYEVNHLIQKLRMIADELERNLKNPPRKKG